MTDDETWIDADHANTLNAFDVGDTRTTHAIVDTVSTLQAQNGRGFAVNAEMAAGGQLLPQTFSVYPEGGNGADIAAAPVDKSPALTKVKSERGVHVTHVAPTLTQYNLDSRSPQSEEQQRIVGAVHEATMSVRRLTPIECERLMGWPDNWTAPKGVNAPDSKRYAACGDGIVSWVAYWIGCRIQMIEAETEATNAAA